MIGDRYWRVGFNSDAGIVGRVISVNGQRYPIAGVAAAGFSGISLDGSVDVWLIQPQFRGAAVSAIARLKPGSSRSAAEAAVAAALARTDQERGAPLDPHTVTTVTTGEHGTSALRERYRAPLMALMGLVVLVLLIACANVANLLVVRNLDRAQEFKVRTALGAGRSRLMGQLLVESLALACGGGVAAWFLAKWGVSLLVSTLPSPDAAARLALTAGPRVIAFMALTTLAATLIFAIAPAWRATRIDVASVLRIGPAQTAPAGARRLRLAIVGAQVALSVVLITGAMLFMQTVRNITSMPLGFDRPRIAEIELADRVLRLTPAEVQSAHETLLPKVRAIPGVESAALSLLLFPTWAIGIDQPTGESGFRVSPEYFATMKIPLIRGRLFTRLEGGAWRQPHDGGARSAAWHGGRLWCWPRSRVLIVVSVTRVLEHAVSELLIGLRANDLAVVAVATLAMLLIAAVASILPALRAARIDPLLAIRGE